ncbi:MAG: hypothetical protein HYX64_09550, partial [Gammaproteobacteria bacterium]|nr:hypothetical protein [Gammaproteobacteria bacterium]
MQFLPGGGDVDISEVNAGAATGAGTASFSDAEITVSLTLEQHNGFGTPFIDKDGTQTIVLTTAGIVIGDAGVENYVVIGDGAYTFALAEDDSGLVGGSQNLDLVDPDVFNDIVVFGAGTFSGVLANAGKGDLVQFGGGATDISGLDGGAVTGAELVGFGNTAVSATMTLAQHNGFAKPFGQTGGTQTITLTTNGTATGDIGVEQYVLGEDKTTANVFTVGSLAQNVTGRSGDDTVIYAGGGPSGILLGGGGGPAGDLLILQAPNTVLTAGSGEFERLTLTVPDGRITSDVFAHNGFNGAIDAPGTNIYTVDDDAGGTLTGLFGFEDYNLVSNTTGFTFTLTGAQTGTIKGSDQDDIFFATAKQVAGATGINGTSGNDTLNITTNAAGLDLNSRTSNIDIYNLDKGSSANVTGANGTGIKVDTSIGNAANLHVLATLMHATKPAELADGWSRCADTFVNA